MIELKTTTELDTMRQAGVVVARALAAAREQAQPGTTLHTLDEVARTVIGESGAVALLDRYQPYWAPCPFPAAISTSVNDTILHGIPSRQRLTDGDLLSLGCGASVDGWCAEAALTFPVGTAFPEDTELVCTTREALEDGIAAARAGGRLGDLSRTIGLVGHSARYGIPDPLGGHGIGRDWYEAPFVPNDGRPGHGMPLTPGMVLTLKPVFLAGGDSSLRTGRDGWSLLTSDESRAAHEEHTVAITTSGPLVLTGP